MFPNKVDPSSLISGSVTRHKKSKLEPPMTTGRGRSVGSEPEAVLGAMIVGAGIEEGHIRDGINTGQHQMTGKRNSYHNNTRLNKS